MKHIKKIVLIAVLAVVLVAIAAVVWIDRIAKVGIEKGGTFALGVPTTLDSASIGILSGNSAITVLQVANPPGYSAPHFLKLNSGQLNVALGSLTKDTIEVPLFALTGIDVNLEKKAGKANYQVITDSLSRLESGKDKPAESKEAKETGEGKKFVIREIVIKDVKAHVNLLPIGGNVTEVTVPIDELRLTDVGTGGKAISLAELTNTLVKAILTATITKGGGVIPPEVLGDLQGSLANLQSLKDVGATLAVNVDGAMKDIAGGLGKAAQGLGEAVKNPTEAAQKLGEAAKDVTAAPQKLGDAAQDATKKVTGALDNLLQKKDAK